MLGDEPGEDSGKKATIVRALYGLKSSGAAFRAHLCGCMQAMGHKPCLADPDLWMHPQVHEGRAYYSYILRYVDDIMVIHQDAMPVLNRINEYMKLKEGSVGDPDLHLGAKLCKVVMPNGVWYYCISPSKYVQETVRNCEIYLKEKFPDEYELTRNAPNPFPMDYEPSMDTSALLEPEQASYYQTITGVMRWMVEIGRIDTTTEVSQLSSFLAMPRRGT